MNAADQRRLTPVLAGLAVALGAGVLLLAAGVGRGVHWDPPALTAPLPAPAAAGAAAGVPLQQFALVWQKPLFNPDRQPLVRAVEGRSSIGDLTLTGVIMTPTLRLALLHDRNGNRELRLHEGEASADGSVTLVEVRPRSAVFDSPSGRVELQLPAGAPLATTAGDAPGAQAAQGAPLDSRAMAATTPSPEAAGRRAGQGAMAPQASGAPGRAMPATSPLPAAMDRARQADHHAAPATAIDRVRAAVQQRRAAQAAAPPQGGR